nr:hypothetical protein [Tanacetum cinerariifolium]
KSSSIVCNPCICDCPPPLSLLKLAPGLANLSVTDCGKDDPDLKEEMEKQFVDLLSEELKLQETVGDEHMRHMNITFGEARRVAAQYQKEAEKCNTATETCEQAREQAEALMRQEKKITSECKLNISNISSSLLERDDAMHVPFGDELQALNICVLDFLMEYFPEIEQISHISKFRDRVHMALRGLRVSVTHRPTKGETYIISGLTESITINTGFELKDNTGKKEGINLIEYYRRKWNRNIVHWSIPCLKLGRCKPNYVPMEFCVLVDDTSFPKEKLGTEASRKLKEVSLLSPDVRRSEISRMVHDKYAIYCRGHSAKVFESFKVEVGINMTEVIGQVMNPPKLKIGDNHTITGNSYNRDWECFNGEPVFTVKAAKEKLRDCCTGKEVEMENPLVVHEAWMSELSSLSKVRALLSSVIEESSKIDEDPLHQFLANLCLNINVKLGGINVKLHYPFPHFSDDDNFMFIGADVSHPDKLKRLSYSSVAALVGSVNPPTATRYTARVSFQSPGKEEIVDFGHMCLELVNAYEQMHGMKPKKIVVFRDGVSDLQFDMILQKEMGDMEKAIYTKSYSPLITFAVARKRHNIRLFLDDEKYWGNVPPGTTVDAVIDHPFEIDFYLCSHFGATGTSLHTTLGQMLQEVAWLTRSSAVTVADCLKDLMFFI